VRAAGAGRLGRAQGGGGEPERRRAALPAGRRRRRAGSESGGAGSRRRDAFAPAWAWTKSMSSKSVTGRSGPARGSCPSLPS
jgi:hypothetical protein